MWFTYKPRIKISKHTNYEAECLRVNMISFYILAVLSFLVVNPITKNIF